MTMLLKRSRYAIMSQPLSSVVHTQPVRVIYCTRTGGAVVADEQLCRSFETDAIDKIPPGDRRRLMEIEALVPAEDKELVTVIERNKAAIADMDQLDFVIQPSASCQLGCGYCGQVHTKKMIGRDSYDAIVKRLDAKMKFRKYNTVRVAWFGGEPLMALITIQELTPLLKEVVERHGCTYSAYMVTNGLSLKEKIFRDLVTNYHLDYFEITLDGTKEFHDQRRHTKEGEATFDLIFKNIERICNLPDYKELGANICIRSNIDERNADGMMGLIRKIADAGLQEKVSVYAAPVHSWGNDAHKKSLSKQEFADLEIDWLMEMMKLGFRTPLLPSLREIVCMSVTPDSELIDAYGNIYNCTEIPYVPVYDNSHYIIGNTATTVPGETDKPRVYSDWYDEIRDKDNTCSSCRMLPVCGGACPKSWNEDHAACPSNKFNIEDKLALAYLYANEPGFLQGVK